MKKVLIVLVVLNMFFSLFSLNISAEDEIEKYIQMLQDSIPPTLRDYYEDLNEQNSLPDLNDITNIITKELQKNLSRPLKILSALAFVIIIASVYHSFESLLQSSRLSRMFDLICNLCIILSFIKISFSSIDIAYTYIKEISNFSMMFFPVMSGVSFFSGNINEAIVSSSGMVLFVAICEKIMCDILVPIIKIMSALSICSSFDNYTVDISGIVKFLKGLFSTILGFCMMLFGAVLSYQSIISTAKDSLGVKTIKFTVGTAIPVVGASVAEALRTIGGALSLLKSTVGGVGVSVVILLLLPCIISVVTDRMTLSAGAALSRLVGCKKEAQLLETVASVYGYVVALVCVVSLMLVFILSVFASTASSIGG